VACELEAEQTLKVESDQDFVVVDALVEGH